jgi:hypothetical protein
MRLFPGWCDAAFVTTLYPIAILESGLSDCERGGSFVQCSEARSTDISAHGLVREATRSLVCRVFQSSSQILEGTVHGSALQHRNMLDASPISCWLGEGSLKKTSSPSRQKLLVNADRVSR